MSVFNTAVLQGLNAIELLVVTKQDAAFVDPKDIYKLCSTSAAIARATGSTKLVMQRTLNNLSRSGIITAHRGRYGGFRVTDEQLRTKRVSDVLGALGQPIFEPEGHRGSDRIQQAFYDMCNVTLEEFFR